MAFNLTAKLPLARDKVQKSVQTDQCVRSVVVTAHFQNNHDIYTVCRLNEAFKPIMKITNVRCLAKLTRL